MSNNYTYFTIDIKKEKYIETLDQSGKSCLFSNELITNKLLRKPQNYINFIKTKEATNEERKKNEYYREYLKLKSRVRTHYNVLKINISMVALYYEVINHVEIAKEKNILRYDIEF